MPAVLLGLVVVGCAVWWLHRAGRLGEVADKGRDTKAQLFPARPIARKALPRRLLKVAENTRTVGVTGNVLLPTQIEIAVNPEDIEAFADATDWLQRDIAEALRQKAVAEGWIVPDGPEVAIVLDPDRPVGVPKAVGRLGALKPSDVQTLVRPQDPPDPPDPPDPEGPAGATAVPDPGTIASPSLSETVRTSTVLALRLVNMHGDGSGIDAPLVAGGEAQVLGRSADADLVVSDREVSGRHCTIAADDDSIVTVEDLGSTNGTFVDGQRVTGPAPLKQGTILRTGKTAWRVELPAAG